jgi:hypothetical protein
MGGDGGTSMDVTTRAARIPGVATHRADRLLEALSRA